MDQLSSYGVYGYSMFETKSGSKALLGMLCLGFQALWCWLDIQSIDAVIRYSQLGGRGVEIEPMIIPRLLRTCSGGSVLFGP